MNKNPKNKNFEQKLKKNKKETKKQNTDNHKVVAIFCIKSCLLLFPVLFITYYIFIILSFICINTN